MKKPIDSPPWHPGSAPLAPESHHTSAPEVLLEVWAAPPATLAPLLKGEWDDTLKIKRMGRTKSPLQFTNSYLLKFSLISTSFIPSWPNLLVAMIQEKQQRACVLSKHRPSGSGPGGRPPLGSCSAGALAPGPSQLWPLCFLARPCEFSLCCNLQAKLLPPVHILKLKFDFPNSTAQ